MEKEGDQESEKPQRKTQNKRKQEICFVTRLERASEVREESSHNAAVAIPVESEEKKEFAIISRVGRLYTPKCMSDDDDDV